nr:PREDICTED: uncharacterized protein LOC102352138 [Latimeria chalumnae]|eukprot:XP_014347598.1 PREDICTED: uncharacterized protein LOC102352138 [Latimeria chalumnae]
MPVENHQMYFRKYGTRNWPRKLLTSTLSYEPQVKDNGCELVCTFLRGGKEIPNTSRTTGKITVLARPEVSDIKEVPLSGEDEVKFTVDVSKFYPEEIQIHWSHNGKELKGKTSEPQCIDDGTYSVTNQIVIPEGELKEKDQIKVIIKHDSMVKPTVKEKTLQDPAGWRNYTISGNSMPTKTILGDRITLDCNVTGCLPKSLEIEWTKKKGKNITELYSSKQGDEIAKYKVNNINGAGKSGHLQSILTFSPEIREDDEAEFACRFINPNTGMTLEKRSAPCKIMAKPTVSAIQERPVTDEEVVNFTVDVTEFYPRDIQIFWARNSHPLAGQGEPQTNADGTYSIRQTVAIPEGDLMAGDEVGVSVKHASLESALTKEITAVDTATRRGYRISKISMPQKVIHGEQTSLTCEIRGILPKSKKITWIKKMRGDENIKYIAQSGADFNKSELVSQLRFTPNIVEDEGAVFICRFSHETVNVTMDSGPAVCKVFVKPEISAIKRLPMSEKDEVKFAVDIDVLKVLENFYQQPIDIKWEHEGRSISQDPERPVYNKDTSTYSINSTITIPEGEVKAEQKINVIIGHASMESNETREIITEDPVAIRKYTISNVALPKRIITGKEMTLTCTIEGILPKSLDITWVKRKDMMDTEIKEKGNTGAAFKYKVTKKETGLHVQNFKCLDSMLTFTPSTEEDNKAEFICPQLPGMTTTCGGRSPSQTCNANKDQFRAIPPCAAYSGTNKLDGEC